MRGFFRLALLLVLMAAAAPAADMSFQDLKDDAVAVQDGRMVYEEYGLITAEDGSQKQIRIHSEMAVGTISRDYFCIFTALVMAEFQKGVGEWKTILEPIGDSDFELGLTLTETGVQIAFKDNTTNQTSRNTLTWEQVFAQG